LSPGFSFQALQLSLGEVEALTAKMTNLKVKAMARLKDNNFDGIDAQEGKFPALVRCFKTSRF
jgi:hypothetical protein